ncbi:unnamed protein product [Cuscuta campestris]|uniref:Uncharacterized protein n=1 Tax=Cuscuta campestris TaxID=132261 RepID=A0A484MLR7_9ASTE|nr:unnamed protein product [Cuscuta campestris]
MGLVLHWTTTTALRRDAAAARRRWRTPAQLSPFSNRRRRSGRRGLLLAKPYPATATVGGRPRLRNDGNEATPRLRLSPLLRDSLRRGPHSGDCSQIPKPR